MRFHKAEFAFFVFIALLFVTAAANGSALFALKKLDGLVGVAAGLNALPDVQAHVGLALVLLLATIGFGLLFIYPLLRAQVRLENSLLATTRSLSARSETLEHVALTDGLTGMQNRRYFDDALREYLQEFQRIDRPVGLMIIDLDHFKQINDTYGHDTGDEVLRAVASCLKELIRAHDVLARLGGEEFAVLVPNVKPADLSRLADRVCKAVGNVRVLRGTTRVRVTASVGATIWDGKETASEFYSRADRSLYRAKREGRNRVCA